MIKKIKEWCRRQKQERKNVVVEEALKRYSASERPKRNTQVSCWNSILFLREDNKLGDMVISTYLFHAIKMARPEVEIYVISGNVNGQVIENSPDVDHLFFLERRNISQAQTLASTLSQKKIDIVVDFSDLLSEEKIALIRLIGANMTIGYGAEAHKLFDVVLDKGFLCSHITQRYQELLQFLNITPPEVNYFPSWPMRESSRDRFVVVNLFGASKHRTFKKKNAKKLLARLLFEKMNVVVVIDPKHHHWTKVLKPLMSEGLKIVETNTIQVLFETIGQASLVISPDTAIVHIANMYQIPVIALYRQENAVRCWGPIGKNDKVFIAPGKSDDINAIECDQVVQSALNLISGNRVNMI